MEFLNGMLFHIKFYYNQAPAAVSTSDIQLLSEIKNELVEIKNILAKK